MSVTRWVDNETKSIDDAIRLILEHKNAESSTSSVTYTNWTTDKAFDKNCTITINNKNINFNYISYSYNTIESGDQPIADRTSMHHGFIIVYDDGAFVNYIIDQNSTALGILRKLIGYKGRNEITRNNFDLVNDMLIWLISKVYQADGILTKKGPGDKLKDLRIKAIKGIKGDTDDLNSKVMADGDSVMNIISSLSFILESKTLNQVKMEISFEGHKKIVITLNRRNTFDVSVRQYTGEFENEIGSLELLKSKLYLLIYLEILPRIIETYQKENERGSWNKTQHISFLKKVAEDLSEKVNNRIALLNINK